MGGIDPESGPGGSRGRGHKTEERGDGKREGKRQENHKQAPGTSPECQTSLKLLCSKYIFSIDLLMLHSLAKKKKKTKYKNRLLLGLINQRALFLKIKT